MQAVIIAGGKKEKKFEAIAPEAINKAFIKINNKYIVEFVLDALEKSVYIKDIILVAPPDAPLDNIRRREKVIKIVPSGETIVDSTRNGLQAISSPSDYVLLVVADIPLITSTAIDDFVERCREDSDEADFYYSIIPKEVSVKKFPQVRHTYVKLKDGTFCGGGLILLKPQLCTPQRCSLMDKLVKSRKKPWNMALILGLNILTKLLLGKLSKQEIEELVSSLSQCKAKGIITSYPEVGVNVDKEGDLKTVEELMLI